MSRLCARRSKPGGLPPFGDGVDGKAAGVVIAPVASARCTLSPPSARARLRQREDRGDAHRDQERELAQGRIEAEAARGQVRRIVPDEKEVARVPSGKEESEDPKLPSAHEASESGFG